MKSAALKDEKPPIVILPSITSLPPIIMTIAIPILPITSKIGLTSSFTFTLFMLNLKNLLFSTLNLSCSNA